MLEFDHVQSSIIAHLTPTISEISECHTDSLANDIV